MNHIRGHSALDILLMNIASYVATMSLNAMYEEIARKFMNVKTLQELNELIVTVVKHTGIGDRQKKGFLNSACGISKIGMWRAPGSLVEEHKSDPRHILINSANSVYTIWL
ncbi:unnamed protein product [Hymenolepis diminuta]|uniref:Uncharacterized protein n=1 Tax=Hymenolepis diminuta TaxID=6216 RepID=A0A564XYW9_HYMDI|nr:unnamed protein product [Hymenolepis diminuta]